MSVVRGHLGSLRVATAVSAAAAAASVEPSGRRGRRSGWERRFPGLLASILAASPPRRPAD
ncbi:hypothetical protein ABZ815_11910 [Nonomuraea sp. NPDC047529]|uniref:hypothetical protein n=1 Tax=Nonomuraea sp. NPDC047529 TaxID=3155623 RepID=UPI0033F84D25